MIKKEFICLKEAAQILGLSEKTMKQIIVNNGIHFTKLNGKILINKQKLLEFLENNSKINS